MSLKEVRLYLLCESYKKMNAWLGAKQAQKAQIS